MLIETGTEFVITGLEYTKDFFNRFNRDEYTFSELGILAFLHGSATSFMIIGARDSLVEGSPQSLLQMSTVALVVGLGSALHCWLMRDNAEQRMLISHTSEV